jgi:phosphoglycolate phosphatase
MPPPRLLVFDLDGTLIDSSLDLCNTVNATLEHVGKPTLPHAVITSFVGDGAAMLVRRALGDPGDLDSLDPTNPAGEQLFHRAFDFFLSYYRIHKLDNTRVYDGVLEALTVIRTAHPTLPMAILTNKPVIPSREICTALKLAPFFFQNYGGNSFPTKKPDPEGLKTLIAEASTLTSSPILPHQVVMIGDSDIDILTGHRAGTRTLACTFGLSPHTLAAAQPDLTVDHPSQWPEALDLLTTKN